MDNETRRIDFEAGIAARKAKIPPLENPYFAVDHARFDSWSDGWIYQEIETLGRKSSLARDVKLFQRFNGPTCLGITASWGQTP